MFEDEYATEAEIPAVAKHLFKAEGGKFVLISVGELKTVTDVNNVQEALRKEREDHKASKSNLAKFNGLDPTTVLADLDKIEEYKLAAEGNMDDEKINNIVESRIKSKTAPLERQITTLTTERNELQLENEGYVTTNTNRKIDDKIRKAATDAKVVGTALEDAVLIGRAIMTVDDAGNVVTKDNVGVTPGVEPTVWLSEVKPVKTHWWPESEGVGAKGGKGGGGGNNPFTAANWNRTEQGAMVRDNPERAAQMAKAAGTSVGGARPAEK